MILLIQWKAAYTVMVEYKTMASGRAWDDKKSVDINGKDPAFKISWEGYTKLPISPFNVYIIIISNYILSSSKKI